MIFVDANILLYAENSSSLLHEEARLWWDKQLSGKQPVCFCWTVLNAFYVSAQTSVCSIIHSVWKKHPRESKVGWNNHVHE